MPKNTNIENARTTYVLRVSIADSSPKIWRKLSVPGGCTLGDLHWIIQIAFGWDNDHLHSFTVGSTRYGIKDADFGFDENDNSIIDENDVCLYDLNLQTKQKFRYLYDFGDSWEHEITVSKTTPAGDDEKPARPRCLDGKRAGPPEDSGGIWGYESMLEILKDPTRKDYEEIHEWLGDIDPEHFEIEEINARLENYFKH
ncbi:MAG: plasmid pRiA4b ORF-3 family protein [Spirochaetaceae bacterium]|jgi:hypothetical protein|nr:plasmid pRiA4b ORF-3 family protein [Spirochaetaceae bacterium]